MNKGSTNKLIVDSIENIGPHYARTLREWARKFTDCFDDVIAPTLRKEHPTVLGGTNGAAELEVFRRKWLCASAFPLAVQALTFADYFYYCEIGFSSRTLGDVILTATREVSELSADCCLRLTHSRLILRMGAMSTLRELSKGIYQLVTRLPDL